MTLRKPADQPDAETSGEEMLARSILETIENIDKTVPLGTHEHGRLVGSALMQQWPKLKLILERMAGRRPGRTQ